MRRHIKKLMLALLMSVQIFALPTMAQVVVEKESVIANDITGIKPGLRGQVLKATTTLNKDVAMQEGDTFVLGFYNTDGTNANDALVLEELPQFKMVYKGETLVENKDFTMALQEGQIVIQFKGAIEGNLEINIEHLVVKSEMSLERNYYLILEARQGENKKKLSIQRVPIDYGHLGTLGGRILFTAESQSCEVEEQAYKMRGIAYQDTLTGQMMVPLKDTLMALGTKEKKMQYSKGNFEVTFPLKHTFTVGSNIVVGEKGDIELSGSIILKDNIMYIGLEDLAKVLQGSVLKDEQNTTSQMFHLPVSAWLDINVR